MSQKEVTVDTIVKKPAIIQPTSCTTYHTQSIEDDDKMMATRSKHLTDLVIRYGPAEKEVAPSGVPWTESKSHCSTWLGVIGVR